MCISVLFSFPIGLRFVILSLCLLGPTWSWAQNEGETFPIKERTVITHKLEGGSTPIEDWFYRNLPVEWDKLDRGEILIQQVEPREIELYRLASQNGSVSYHDLTPVNGPSVDGYSRSVRKSPLAPTIEMVFTFYDAEGKEIAELQAQPVWNPSGPQYRVSQVRVQDEEFDMELFRQAHPRVNPVVNIDFAGKDGYQIVLVGHPPSLWTMLGGSGFTEREVRPVAEGERMVTDQERLFSAEAYRMQNQNPASHQINVGPDGRLQYQSPGFDCRGLLN